jgi:hypothetical protein
MTGVLSTWSFASQPGSQAMTAPAMAVPGVTSGPIGRSPGLSTATGASSINASNWSTASHIDPTKYYTLSITPAAGCALDITSISIDVKSSATGPTAGALATSSDSFAANVALGMNTAGSYGLAVSSATGTVELRIYGYSASGTTGTMRVQGSLSATGTLH